MSEHQARIDRVAAIHGDALKRADADPSVGMAILSQQIADLQDALGPLADPFAWERSRSLEEEPPDMEIDCCVRCG